ncbi:hypothetical protein HYE18_02980 [Mycoplasmopsis bovis]|nr:hypothetical protein [Mycoplasmopsis bovis]QQH25118.1 hypothetical protein HYE18_02980 [Mycoplasmopsis bovis]
MANLLIQDQNNDSVDNLINEIYQRKTKNFWTRKIKKADLNNLIIYKNDNDNSYYDNQSTKPYIKLGNIADYIQVIVLIKHLRKNFCTAFSRTIAI